MASKACSIATPRSRVKGKKRERERARDGTVRTPSVNKQSFGNCPLKIKGFGERFLILEGAFCDRKVGGENENGASLLSSLSLDQASSPISEEIFEQMGELKFPPQPLLVRFIIHFHFHFHLLTLPYLPLT